VDIFSVTFLPLVILPVGIIVGFIFSNKSKLFAAVFLEKKIKFRIVI